MRLGRSSAEGMVGRGWGGIGMFAVVFGDVVGEDVMRGEEMSTAFQIWRGGRYYIGQRNGVYLGPSCWGYA